MSLFQNIILLRSIIWRWCFPTKDLGFPLAFFDREIHRPGERGGWWWSSPRVTPTRWKSFLSRFPIKFDERQESGASRSSIRCGVRACSSASMSPTTMRTRAPRPSVFPSSMCTAYTGSSQGGFSCNYLTFAIQVCFHWTLQ